jgi:hypothetical protein
MGRIKVSKPAIIDSPASFKDLTVNGNLTIPGISNLSQSIAQGVDGSITLSASFNNVLTFNSNKIMATSSNNAISMSLVSNAKLNTLGKVIMTDISASGLHLDSSDFKVLNGTFDSTKRNYIYYHFIGTGGTNLALVTINQEVT